MNKTLIAAIAATLLLVGAYFTYNYVNGPKIIDGVVSKGIDDNGKPIHITNEFSSEDTVYFSAKVNRFWIKNAQVVWYQGKVKTANRFLVQEDIAVSNGGYFSTKLSAPEGLEEGHYSVSIYVTGNDIIETHDEFDVKDK